MVHSSTLDQRKEKSLAKKWAKQKEELEKAGRELAQRPFACEADAVKAVELFIKEHHQKPFTLSGEVTKELLARYPKPGRPKKETPPESTVVYRAHVQVSEDQEAMAHEKDLASTFVLITNLMDAEKHPAREVLKEYKEQNAVERQFRFLKQPFLLDRSSSKTRAGWRPCPSPLVLPGQRKSTNPTVRALLEMLAPLVVVKQGQDRALINYHGLEVIRAIKLAGLGKEIYLFPACAGG